MKKEKNGFKCGVVSIVGRPNVGKSTLLNAILDEKVSIVSDIPQTTRNQIKGIYNEKRGQIVFIDTPGLHLGRDRLGQFMNHSSTSTIDGTDCIIYLVDTSRRVGEEEINVANKLSSVKVPIILGFNKADLKGQYLDEHIKNWESIKGKPVTKMKNFQMIALSATKGHNIPKLIDLIFETLPVQEAFYPPDIVCDVPQRMAIADIIREKFLKILRDELPHSLGVVIESMETVKKGVLLIKALVLVERDSQKEIVIGNKGKNLKLVGQTARLELEDLLEKRIFLELYVKEEDNWRNNPEFLLLQGYQF